MQKMRNGIQTIIFTCVLTFGIFILVAYAGQPTFTAGTITYERCGMDGNGDPFRQILCEEDNTHKTTSVAVYFMKAIEHRSFLNIPVVYGSTSASIHSDKNASNGKVSKTTFASHYVSAIGTWEIDLDDWTAKRTIVGKLDRGVNADADAYFTTNFDAVNLRAGGGVTNQDGDAYLSGRWQ